MRSIPVIGVNTDTEQTVFFKSIRQFARFVSAQSQSRSTATRRVAAGGGLVETRTESWYVERV